MAGDAICWDEKHWGRNSLNYSALEFEKHCPLQFHSEDKLQPHRTWNDSPGHLKLDVNHFDLGVHRREWSFKIFFKKDSKDIKKLGGTDLDFKV